MQLEGNPIGEEILNKEAVRQMRAEQARKEAAEEERFQQALSYWREMETRRYDLPWDIANNLIDSYIRASNFGRETPDSKFKIFVFGLKNPVNREPETDLVVRVPIGNRTRGSVQPVLNFDYGLELFWRPRNDASVDEEMGVPVIHMSKPPLAEDRTEANEISNFGFSFPEGDDEELLMRQRTAISLLFEAKEVQGILEGSLSEQQVLTPFEKPTKESLDRLMGS